MLYSVIVALLELGNQHINKSRALEGQGTPRKSRFDTPCMEFGGTRTGTLDKYRHYSNIETQTRRVAVLLLPLLLLPLVPWPCRVPFHAVSSW